MNDGDKVKIVKITPEKYQELKDNNELDEATIYLVINKQDLDSM